MRKTWLELIHIFRDEGISGTKINEEALEVDRVGLQEMLAHLSSLQIKYVVVLNTSRFINYPSNKYKWQKKVKSQEILCFMNTTNASERKAKQKDKRWFVSGEG
ncbi:recombinase family protein [Symbiobacterium thermophilum]|uniref:recombinase family protein n=1 Tax=Symbiobacterium thermophilum TaxID=2734 RepID=UPI0001B0FDE2|nr:hypothetical protein PTHTG4_20990 [Parageobacillus thermoglucosidasius]